MSFKIDDFRNHFMKNHHFFHKNKKTNNRKKKILLNDFDKLFFNFLVIIKYDIPIHYNKHEERMIKIQFAQKLETFKYRKKEDIIQNLSYEDNIHLQTIACLAKYFKVNMIYSYGNVCVNMNHYENNKVFMINHKKDIFMLNEDKLNTIIDSSYLVTDINKPIYSEGHYKVKELKDIIIKIDIDNDKLTKKSDYYNHFKSYLDSVLF